MTKDEALKLALEAGFRVGPSREGPDDVWGVGANLERFAKLVAEKAIKEALTQPEQEQEPTTGNILMDSYKAMQAKKLTAQPEQKPVAYDKTELNCFAQDLYDQKMREGSRGHYESMFHVIHQCIKKVEAKLKENT